MTSYALYRLPYADSYQKIESEQEPVLLYDYNDIDKYSGFCVAPFCISPTCPIVIIPTDGSSQGHHNLPSTTEVECHVETNYKEAFHKFHSAVSEGRFTKLVLSRKEERTISTDDYEYLFHKACKMYPRMMIILVFTPVTGTWLVATPEILVERNGINYRTMALAGTMPFQEGLPTWSEKNKHEQQVVSDYIEQTIAPFATNIIKDGPHTKRAGNVVHLLTEFRFQLSTHHSSLTTNHFELLSSIHPTPAICGLPKQEAYNFILHNEGYNRKYYSGFMGPLNLQNQTHLYVTLRCAELNGRKAILYAGGGIMPESVENYEYEETVNKMKTIGNVLE